MNTWTKYEEYYCQDQISKLPNGGYYVIEPGKTAWLLGDEMLTLTNESRWSPMNLVLRIRTEGTVTVSIAAFRNKNNVHTPLSPELKYNKDTQRTYPEGVSSADKEGDLDGKSKGLSNSVAEVEAVTSWIIDDSTEYFTPTVYNMANPFGFTIAKNGHANYWVTNYNVNQDSSSTNNGTESEMLPLEFIDSTRTWIFDTRHYTPMNGNGPISGTPPISNAVIMGNYGVTQRYIIDISNITEFDKNVVYQLGTKSHAIIRYKLDSMQSWNTIVKCNTINDSYNTQNDIFEVMIPALSKDRLVFEVMLPNADNGGFHNSLKVK